MGGLLMHRAPFAEQHPPDWVRPVARVTKRVPGDDQSRHGDLLIAGTHVVKPIGPESDPWAVSARKSIT